MSSYVREIYLTAFISKVWAIILKFCITLNDAKVYFQINDTLISTGILKMAVIKLCFLVFS